MSLEIVDRPALQVVGLQIRTTPRSSQIPALWPKFVARIDEIGHAAEPRVSYGVMRHDSGVLEYTAAISVTSIGRLPEGMVKLDLPAGRYAFFAYPLSGLGQGFGEIFERLLPDSAYVQASGPFYERYDEAFDPGKPRSLVQIWIPVVARP